jgi:hypothetical protein
LVWSTPSIAKTPGKEPEKGLSRKNHFPQTSTRTWDKACYHVNGVGFHSHYGGCPVLSIKVAVLAAQRDNLGMSKPMLIGFLFLVTRARTNLCGGYG